MAIKQTATVSLDIGNSNLKIIQTSADGKIMRFAVHKMPEGCVDDLNIISDEAMARSIKAARKNAKIPRGKRCTLVISGSDIIIRHFTLPILDADQLYQNILHEMSGYLPVDADKYYVDYKIIGKEQEDGVEMYNVLVTSVHKRNIDSFKKVLRSAGFNVRIVDTCDNAREKLIRFCREKNPSFLSEGGICVIDIGTKHTRATMYNDGFFFLSNVLKRSGQNITETIAQYSGKDILVAEKMKRDTDFLGSDHTNKELKTSVTYEIDSIIYEITRIFDYFKNKTKSNVKTIYISGGGALMPGLREYLEKHMNIPVRLASDLASFASDIKVNANGFAFLLNAYSAIYREEQ